LIKQEPVDPLMVVQSVMSTLIYAGLIALLAVRLYKREALLG
jgi:predicted branched-subunit amino acid permease